MANFQQLSPARIQFVGGNGTPLVGGSVATYIPGTFTPVTTYQDPVGRASNSNPGTLDSIGSIAMWYSGLVRMIVKDANGNQIYDDVTSSGGGSSSSSYEIILPWQAGDQSARIQAQFVTLSSMGGGTLTLDYPDPGQVWQWAPGGVNILSSNTTFRFADRSIVARMTTPLASNKQGITANFLTNVTFEDMTIDGNATVLYVYSTGTPLGSPQTFPVVAGETYKIAIRGTAGSTLTATGPLLAPVVVTGTGMTTGMVTYGYATATANGTCTITPVGDIRFVTIIENGAPLAGLIAAFGTSILQIKNVNAINIDTLGISINSCQAVTIDGCLVQRSAASWEQNVGILAADTLSNTSNVTVKNNTAVLNTGITLRTKNGYIEAGTFIDNVGYSSKVTILSGDCYIGQVFGGPNGNYPDQDDTPPLWHELYGSGTLDGMRCVANNSAGVTISGNWRVIMPYVWNTCAYYAANGIYTVPAITFFYLDATNNAAGSYVISPDCGDTRVGALRTQGYGIGDLFDGDPARQIKNTVVTGARMTNNVTGDGTHFQGTVGRVFSWADNSAGYATQGDADLTWVYGANPSLINFATTFTANRTLTLSNTGVRAGITVDLDRTGLGAFDLIIKNGAGTTIHTMTGATPRWAQFVFNGTQFILSKKGDL